MIASSKLNTSTSLTLTSTEQAPKNETKNHSMYSHDPKSVRSKSTKLYHGQCLERQLFRPKLPYPLWDYNWDGRMTQDTTLESLSTIEGLKKSRQHGTVRHILLIRHGQYDESSPQDDHRHLTPLGRRQAELTGLRLAILARGGLGGIYGEYQRFAGPCKIKALHVSDMVRAKETAAIIAKHLPPEVQLTPPDPLLNEALPSPMLPVRPDVPNAETEIDENHDRIEQAFQKYFYRAAPATPTTAADGTGIHHDDQARTTTATNDNATKSNQLKHEFEVLVGHGNVIRYFVCRALQLPPEAWLRLSVFNCSITYITIQPSGYVSVRMVGDTGHLGYDDTSFSGQIGYNW
jgi:serine/threonine-protein phosphatase PGAM5